MSSLDPTLICFIVRYPVKEIKDIKNKLVLIVTKVEHDTKGYVYSESDHISQWNGEFVADIANARMEVGNLGTALKKSVLLSAHYDVGIKKLFVVLFDKIKPEEVYELQSILNYDSRQEFNSTFLMLSKEEQHIEFNHPRIKQKQVLIDEICNVVLEEYGI